MISRRSAVALAVLLAVLPAAGCLKDIREQNTTILFYLKAAEIDADALKDFSIVDIAVTHVTFRANETGVQPVTIPIGRNVDLVTLKDSGAQKLAERKIPYRPYERVAIGVNVTAALLHDGKQVHVAIPPDNIYFIEKKFRTRLAGEQAYFFAIALMKGARGEYFLQSRPAESGAQKV